MTTLPTWLAVPVILGAIACLPLQLYAYYLGRRDQRRDLADLLRKSLGPVRTELDGLEVLVSEVRDLRRRP